jgi:hypothetical protein
MDLTEIDSIPAPSDPRDESDFNLVRAVVRRHVLAEGTLWLAHHDLEDTVERRRAAAAEAERALSSPLVPLSPADDLDREADLASAREKQRAYSALRAALNHYCSSACRVR